MSGFFSKQIAQNFASSLPQAHNVIFYDDNFNEVGNVSNVQSSVVDDQDNSKYLYVVTCSLSLSSNTTISYATVVDNNSNLVCAFAVGKSLDAGNYDVTLKVEFPYTS